MRHFASSSRPLTFHRYVCALGSLLIAFTAFASPNLTVLSADELAGRLSALRNKDSSYVRLLLKVKQPSEVTKSSLQIQIKERSSAAGTDLLYQILWPKERKGEGVLLHQAANQPPAGTLFLPPNTMHSLDASMMMNSLFGSDLCYEDLISNFFAWKFQRIVGSGVVQRVECQILESKPDGNDSSIYAKVLTWVDPERMVPLRVEKYNSGGKLIRRIETTLVANEQNQGHIPANLAVQNVRTGSLTEITGSRIKYGITYTDHDFTNDALKETTLSKASLQP